MYKTVTLFLPNGKKGNIKVDEDASVADIKSSLLETLQNENLIQSDMNYQLAYIPNNQQQAIGSINLADGDALILIEKPIITWITRPS